MDLIFSCPSLGLSIRIQEKPLIFCGGVLFGEVQGSFGFGVFLCWFLFGVGGVFLFVFYGGCCLHFVCCFFVLVWF